MDTLNFAYPRSNPVLAIQSLDISNGERIFLHGPSGSGKSTLLSLIAGVLQPLSGTLRVLGHDFHRIGAAARDRIRGASMGYIFQNFNLIPYLSVRQNIELPCLLHRERLRRIRSSTLQHEVAHLADRLDMAAFLDNAVDRLSVGQQQRVAIARALIGSPSLLIADEPTSALDIDRRDEFLGLLNELLDESRQFGQPSTLLYVSHDATLAQRFDRYLSLPRINRARAKEGRLGAV